MTNLCRRHSTAALGTSVVSAVRSSTWICWHGLFVFETWSTTPFQRTATLQSCLWKVHSGVFKRGKWQLRRTFRRVSVQLFKVSLLWMFTTQWKVSGLWKQLTAFVIMFQVGWSGPTYWHNITTKDFKIMPHEHYHTPHVVNYFCLSWPEWSWSRNCLAMISNNKLSMGFVPRISWVHKCCGLLWCDERVGSIHW